MNLSTRVIVPIDALLGLATLLLLAGLISACGEQASTPIPIEEEQTGIEARPATPTAPPTQFEPVSPLFPEESPLPTPTSVPQTEVDESPTGPVPIEITPSAIVPLSGEVPRELLEAVFDDLAERVSANRDAIEVEQAGAVTWRDGSLGCPQPGMMYTMALVPGYQIVLRIGEETYDYHANAGGYFLLCAEGMAQKPLPPGEGGTDFGKRVP